MWHVWWSSAILFSIWRIGINASIKYISLKIIVCQIWEYRAKVFTPKPLIYSIMAVILHEFLWHSLHKSKAWVSGLYHFTIQHPMHHCNSIQKWQWSHYDMGCAAYDVIHPLHCTHKGHVSLSGEALLVYRVWSWKQLYTENLRTLDIRM